MDGKNHTRGTSKLHIEAGPPLLASLARIMPEAPALLDALVTEFAPIAGQLSTQQAYWLALNG